MESGPSASIFQMKQLIGMRRRITRMRRCTPALDINIPNYASAVVATNEILALISAL
jgi:hypothetical protein